MKTEIQREVIKNLLRSRTCKNCDRVGSRRSVGRRWPKSAHCHIKEVAPEEGTCSQWKMNWEARRQKETKHREKVAAKRKTRKAKAKIAPETIAEVQESV